MTTIRILTFLVLLPTIYYPLNANAELHTNMEADFVLGEPDFNTAIFNNGGPSPRSLTNPRGLASAGNKLFVADTSNHRILIFEGPIQSNFVDASVVVGQPDFYSNAANQGGGAGANTLQQNWSLSTDGRRLFSAGRLNNRVLIFNQIPTSNNASADVVVGQTNFTNTAANQGGTTAANTLNDARATFSDGIRLFIADALNYRVLIFNKIPTSNNASADVVVGQPDFTSNTVNQGGSAGAHTLNIPCSIFYDGQNFFVSDCSNNRVLIWNELPVANNTPADVVVGQRDFSGTAANHGGAVGPNTLTPFGVFSDGKRLFISETVNHRVLVFNEIPTKNNANADIVIGQPDFFSNAANQGGNTRANTLNTPFSLHVSANQLFVGDDSNRRVLVYNIDSPSSDDLGPQFSQGKTVVGKVFFDWDGDGFQS